MTQFLTIFQGNIAFFPALVARGCQTSPSDRQNWEEQFGKSAKKQGKSGKIVTKIRKIVKKMETLGRSLSLQMGRPGYAPGFER